MIVMAVIYSLSSLPYQSSLTQRQAKLQYLSIYSITTKTKPSAIASLPTVWNKVTCATETKRSANYEPSVWSFDLVQSFNNDDIAVESFRERAKTLETEVRRMFDRIDFELVNMLELIDDIQRLGLRNLFEKDIMKALDKIVSCPKLRAVRDKSLRAAALSFRLLRENGFQASQDVFKRFKENNGNFKPEICNDLKGLLDVYEASFLAFEEDELLDEAKIFTLAHLQNIKSCDDALLEAKIGRAMELPYHHRMHRLEARRQIEIYGKTSSPYESQSLLELATLNFNMTQAMYYQKEIRETSRWWKDMEFAKRLSFARDTSTECYFWALGMISEPQFCNCREELAKVAAFITIIDDVYDVCGTLDELELFTDAVERWDGQALNKLPDYMKFCILALYNTINEIAYKILKEHGVDSLPYLTKAWSDICKAFLQEPRWSHNKVTPTFNDYLENGWVSVSGCLLLCHAMFLLGQDFTKQSLGNLHNHHDLLRLPSVIFRLCNDLATSAEEVKRGETANSITCYMSDRGVSEAQTRRYLRDEIDTTWKRMNKERVNGTPFSKAFVDAAFDLARISHGTYQYGDAHRRPDGRSRNRVNQLIFEPISFPSNRVNPMFRAYT